MSTSNTNVPEGDLPGLCCSGVREVLNFIGDKWSVLIIVILDGGSHRFSELQRKVHGISQRMLTRTLRGLERDGLVLRTVEATVPPSVYYELTPLGKTLLNPVKDLTLWAQINLDKIQKAQEKFDRDTNLKSL